MAQDEENYNFNLISNENAIIPSTIFSTIQEMEEMLKELKIPVKSPLKHKNGNDIKDLASLNPWLNTAYEIVDTLDPRIFGNTTKQLDNSMQYIVFDPEITLDKQFMQSVNTSFSYCSTMNVRIDQILDRLDEIMSKSLDTTRYTQDERTTLSQVQFIYDTLHTTLQSIIDNANTNPNANNVIEKGITSLLVRVDRYVNDYDIDDDNATQDNVIKINSSKYGDSTRARKRIYMRWINSLKECLDSIQNMIGSNISHSTTQTNYTKTSIESNQSETIPIETSHAKTNTESNNVENKQAQDNTKSTSNIEPHQRNPFL